ncbi:MAG: hypothetical protein IKD33_07900, partial [Bacteroidales bacterium]|nr:hypothetical protein [Bacteroidales bacterium]
VDFPGRRANELAVLIGKSVQSVERYVKTLKDAGKIEFRGAPKNGGYYALEKGGDSESDIIRFLRRCGDSFVDVTDFLANSVSNSLQKSSAIQKISVTLLSVIMI